MTCLHGRPLPEVLMWLAQHQRDRRAFTFLSGRNLVETHITYRELDLRARAIAAALGERARPGDRVLLLYPPGLDYVAAFLACQYAAMIAVPAYPPDPRRLERTLPRLLAILTDAEVKIVLTTSEISAMGLALAGIAPDTAGLAWLASDAVEDAEADRWHSPGFTLERLAFLQYTSGSTAAPKGVEISHGHLVHNAAAIRQFAQFEPDIDLGVTWLPMYHDMGLIGNVLQQVFDGYPQLLMSPVTFMKRPASWLEVISRYGVTISAAPNFAFDVCVSKIAPAQRAELDLSRWRLVVSGAAKSTWR